jgi:phospholipid:diacylglycerol acyltransferase
VGAFLNVGGPLLGTPKAFSAVLSGEMKDTSVLGDLGRNILGRVVGKLVVFPRFFRALGSIPSMFPRGELISFFNNKIFLFLTNLI